MFENLFYSLPNIPRNEFTEFIFVNIGSLVLGFGTLFFVLGYWFSSQKLDDAKKTFLVLRLINIPGFIIIISTFYCLKKMAIPYFCAITILLIFIILSFTLGCWVELYLRRKGSYLTFFFIGLIMFLTYFTSTFWFDIDVEKEGLRSLYTKIFGAPPDDEAKQRFWGKTVGEENPDERRKSEYWINRE